MKMKDLAKTANRWLKANERGLLTGSALVGLATSMYAMYKAAPVCDQILKNYKKDMAHVDLDDKKAIRAIKMETGKALAKTLVAPVVLGITTAGCILGSHSVSSKKIAVLTAAYSAADSSLRDLNGKMQEMLGSKKAQAIKESIAKDKVKQSEPYPDPKTNPEGIVITGYGDVLCQDSFSNQLFLSSHGRIRECINSLSARLNQEMYISLNEFYDELGLRQHRMGDELGWNVEDAVGGNLQISTTAILNDAGIPVIYIDYDLHKLHKNFGDM